MTPKAGKVSKKVKDLNIPNEMFAVEPKRNKKAKRYNYCEKCKRYYRGIPKVSYVDYLWHRDFCDEKKE